MRVKFILGLAALVLGLTAAFSNLEKRNGFYPDWKYDTRRMNGEKVRVISAPCLAGLVRSKDRELVLMDVRDSLAYEEYHIPGASMYSKPAFESALKEGKKIVLYGASASTDEILLGVDKSKDACLLKGGLDSWYRLVLFPDFSVYKVRNRRDLERIVSTSNYFGGQPKNTESLGLTKRSTRFREGC